MHLACKHDVLAGDAQVAQRCPDILFTCAETVAVGGVDEIDARIKCSLNYRLGFIRADGPLVKVGACFAETHAAKAEF